MPAECQMRPRYVRMVIFHWIHFDAIFFYSFCCAVIRKIVWVSRERHANTTTIWFSSNVTALVSVCLFYFILNNVDGVWGALCASSRLSMSTHTTTHNQATGQTFAFMSKYICCCFCYIFFSMRNETTGSKFNGGTKRSAGTNALPTQKQWRPNTRRGW